MDIQINTSRAKEINQAIEYIKESLYCHTSWISREDIEPGWLQEEVTREEAGGDISHHEYHIAKYNFVIDVLEKLK